MKTPEEVVEQFTRNSMGVRVVLSADAIRQDRLEHVREIREAIEVLFGDSPSGVVTCSKNRIFSLPCLQLPEPEPEKWMVDAANDWFGPAGLWFGPAGLTGGVLAAIISKHYRKAKP